MKKIILFLVLVILISGCVKQEVENAGIQPPMETPTEEALEDSSEEIPVEKPEEIPLSYHIENVPYYGEKNWCWGSSAMMLLMYQGFTQEKIQQARSLIKTQGIGGPPDMFIAFREYDLLDNIRIAYTKDYVKEYADFYNHQLLINPKEQVIILNNKDEAIQKLKELVSSNVLVMILGHHGNHYMIVTGYDEDSIYINDPGADDVYLTKYRMEYQERTIMSMDQFFEQWTVSGFEGGGIGFPGDCGMIWLEE